MRLLHKAVLPLALSLVILASAGLSYASTVTVDVARKTAKSDVVTLTTAKLRVKGSQTGVFVKSTTLTPQGFTLKFVGIGDGDYDVYINSNPKLTKSAAELKEGLVIKIDGRVVDDAMMDCLTRVQASTNSACDVLSASSDAEAKRVCSTLSQAEDWCEGAQQSDQAWRSASVIILPTNNVPVEMNWLTRENDVETARVVTSSCWLLQKARDRMSHEIQSSDLRNQAVVAMTPVDFNAAYSVKNGKPHIDAKLLNHCNLPISGSISAALPSGWKSTAKKLSFSELKYGKTYSVSFDLVPLSKSAVAAKALQMAANITIVQGEFSAHCKLGATAKTEAK